MPCTKRGHKLVGKDVVMPHYQHGACVTPKLVIDFLHEKFDSSKLNKIQGVIDDMFLTLIPRIRLCKCI